MYFSKNSRYVLQKAQWFTPSSYLFTCLKKNERSLSVKYPKDDPNKPSLRRNIPKDGQSEYYPGFVSEIRGQDHLEERSKSLIARSKNSVFDNVLLPRSESDINISSLRKNEYFEKNEKEPNVIAIEVPKEQTTRAGDEVLQDIFLRSKSKNDDNSDWILEEYSKLESNDARGNAGGSPDGGKNSDSSNYKVVHIIIDFPQKGNETLQAIEQSSKKTAAEENLRIFDIPPESKYFAKRVSEFKQPRKWRSRSVSSHATKQSKKRFEVHEIEDAGTYVLHLKFKDAKDVEVVPEKEVSTRTSTVHKFPTLGTFRKPVQKTAKDSGITEDAQEVVKYLEKKKKKTKRSKSAWKSKSSPGVELSPAVKENVQASEFLDWQQPQYYELPVSDSFEEKKILKTFEKDDFGIIKSSTNKLVFRLPGTMEEANSEEMSPVENSTVKAETELAADQGGPAENENVKQPAVEAAEPETASKMNNEEFATTTYKYPPKYPSPYTPQYPPQYMQKFTPQYPSQNPLQYSSQSPETTESASDEVSLRRSDDIDSRRPDWTKVSNLIQSVPDGDFDSEDTILYKNKNKGSTSTSRMNKSDKKTPHDSGYKASTYERYESDVVDFKNGASSVCIKSEKPTYAMKLSAAHPPLLNEAMKRRYYRYRSNYAYNGREMMSLFSKEFDMNPKCLNATPTKLSKSDSSFGGSKSTNIPKISDNICNIANENITNDKGTASLDSLTMMKKVKEIIELDLNNAIKIFKPESSGVVNSVVIYTGDKNWTVDEKELSKCLTIQKSDFLNDIKKAESARDFLSEKAINVPKYLPTTKGGQAEMKLDYSVVTFNPDTNKFVLDLEDLQEAIKRRTEESFDDVVVEKLEGLLTGSKTEPILVFNAVNDVKKKSKSGDSILVFDEETQSWKVDYSILEKREQQMRVEEELTKRSELILETIEKIEKRNIPSIPKPETRDKKTFDYNKEQWKDYTAEKKSKSKDRFPFKESDTEEIRKKNSDLYDDLFVKKDTLKKSHSFTSTEMKLGEKSDRDTGATKDTGVPSKNPETVPGDPEPITQQSPPQPQNQSEDDNYWGSFLNMVITPKREKKVTDVTDTKKPKIRAPSPPPPPPTSPPTQTPPTGPKIEEPKFKINVPLPGETTKKQENQKIPPKKPELEGEKPKTKAPATPPVKERPKVRSWMPLSKIEKPKTPEASVPPSKKKEEPKVNPPPPPATSKKEDIKPTGTSKKDEPKLKQPPTSTPTKKEDIKPTGTSKKDEPKLKQPPTSTPTKKEDVKLPSANKKDETKLKAPSMPTQIPPGKEDIKPKPPGKEDVKPTTPGKEDVKPPGTTKIDEPKLKPSPTTPTPPKKEDVNPPTPPRKEDIKPPGTSTIDEPKLKPPPPPPPPPPPSPTFPKTEPAEKITPTKDVPKDTPKPGSKNVLKPDIKAPSPSHGSPKEDPKSGVKKDKSAADHYISENIVELSRNSKDKNTKLKSNKIETVKLNITPDKRLPSKVTEINLNKQFENAKEPTTPTKKDKKNGIENRIFYKKFDKYKTPFSDPEYEEKSLRIKSDVASNPNLKKLGNGNKTLVLHDVAKPPENIETWLKDETDKMATLLLKVLQEAADGKPRRKPSRTKLTEKSQAKANPYDNIRKKQETATQESFLFKMRSVNLSPESGKKNVDQAKTIQDLNIHAAGRGKPAIVPGIKESGEKKNEKEKPSLNPTSILSEGKLQTFGFETTDSLISRDFLQQCRLTSEITDDIPGPQLLKRISGSWKIFPVFSAQMTIFTLLRLFHLVNLGKSVLETRNLDKCRRLAFAKLFAKYGPIVNVQGPLSGSVILIHKPEHLSAVFEQDATIPVRSVFDSLEKIRREADEKIFLSGKYTKWDSPHWEELKKHSNDPMIKGREKFYTAVEAASNSLIRSIRRNKNLQNCTSDDFMDNIKRWSLEGLCNVLFEKSFGFLESRSKNADWILEPDKLLTSIDEMTSYLSKCEKGFQTWRLMTTPSVAKLKQSRQLLTGIITKQLYQAEANLTKNSEALKNGERQRPKDLTFLEGMLLNDGMTAEEVTCNLIDILVIGMNTMSSALGFLLYDLSQNVKAQKKLASEVRNVLAEKNSPLDFQKFHSMKYLQACLKESLRLHMPLPIFHRQLQNDILLANYIVPKGTYVVMDYRVSCMREQIFDEAERFLPERWLEDEKWIDNHHPFDTLPVCHGPRAELTKRLIETQILTCVAKIVRNFEIDYQFGEIQETDGIISFPDKPLKFTFVERDY